MTHGTAGRDDAGPDDPGLDDERHDDAGHDNAGASMNRRRTDRSSKVMAAVVGLALAGVLTAAGFFVTTALLGPHASL
jgi:hypothetical protein